MIPATPKNIEWLLERLYSAQRELQTNGVIDPQFVLLTKGKEDRHRVEDIIYRYLSKRYGDLVRQRVHCDISSKGITRINVHGIMMVLLDLEEMEPAEVPA